MIPSPSPPAGWARGLRRAGWTIADQALSSLTNMALAVMVARAVAPNEFGAFALAFATYLIALGISRALATDALGVRFSGVTEDEWRIATAHASGVAVSVGLVGSVLLGTASLLTRGPLSPSLLMLAAVLPGLLLQDAWRFAFFAAGRPQKAAVNDGAWAAVLAGLLAMAIVGGASVAWHFIGVWGAAATAASLLGIAQAGTWPSPASARQWLRSHRELWPSYLGEFGVQSGVTQLITFGVAALAGLSAAGALRGAQVLFGPVNVVFMAAVAIAVPEGARLRRRSRRALTLGMTGVSVSVAGVALVWGLLVWTALPEVAGRALLGDTWAEAVHVLPWLGLLMAVSGATTGAIAGLRVLERQRRSLAVRALVAPLLIAGGLGGAAVAGAPGAVWGQIGPLLLAAVLWWYQLLRGAWQADEVADLPAGRPALPRQTR